MLLHPGVIALLTGSVVAMTLLVSAGAFGYAIVRRWDIKSSSEDQLRLERRTYLISTLVKFAFFFEIVSLFLFIYTADDLHNLLTGAMCATGSLNANDFGFPALYLKVLSLFLAAVWIGVNGMDEKAEDSPLTRPKYKFLLFALPFVLAGDILQALFFMRIDPQVITSCCGTLFSEGGAGTASSLASFPVAAMKTVFFLSAGFLIIAGIFAARNPSRAGTTLFGLSSSAFFFIGIAAVVSFISPYYYQLPTHHCPFDMLQSGYHYVGYPLYLSLFLGVYFGMMTGISGIFGGIGSLKQITPVMQKRYAARAVICILIFTLLSAAPMLLLPMTMD